MAYRTFIAVDPDDSTRRALAGVQKRLSGPGQKINWVSPANLHVTLAFLGDVADGQLDAVCRAARDVADAVSPFGMEVAGVQVVPDRGPVRMLWASLQAAALSDLAGRLAGAFEPLGFPPERRPFCGHLTLARVKWIPDLQAFRSAAARMADDAFGHVEISRLTVYTSHRTSDGPVYTPAATCPLGGSTDSVVV